MKKCCWAIVVILLCAAVARADDQLGELRAVIIEALIGATDDPDASVRREAYSALRPQQRSDAIIGALRRGLTDMDGQVRHIALTTLIRHEGPTDELIKELFALMRDEPSLAAAAKSELLQIGEPAVPQLIEAMSSEDATIKHHAIEVLGRIDAGSHQKAVVTELAARTKDKDREIRLLAISALSNLSLNRASSSDARYVAHARGLVKKYDTNSDGVLTEGEWNSLDASSIDQDKDGRITAEEIARHTLKSSRSFGGTSRTN